MKIIDVKQGTPEWHQARAKRFTASEAPAMMGAGKYTTRDGLLQQKATGVLPEVTASMQMLFDQGHASEALARFITEADIDDGLYPLVAVHDEFDWMLASFDGITIEGDIIWEHKLWNEKLAAQVRAGDLEPHYYWQLEQQLLVSGADKAIFVTSDGTKENWEQMEYRSDADRRKSLLAGWQQFKLDLESYTPQEVAAAVVAEPIAQLPTLLVQITGGVTRSNLDGYEQFARNYIRSINTDLQTDEDFANADAAVKFCASTEKELDAVKQAALNQTADIADLFKTIDTIKAEMRTKRLAVDKLVKARKQSLREQAISKAKAEFTNHIASLERRLSHVVSMPEVATNFTVVIKNKRTIASLDNAINTELARAKIEANAVADRIDTNIKAMLDHAPVHRYLFTDLQQTCTKPADDFVAMVKMRVAEHKAAEQAKAELLAEQQRDRIRKEEAAKAELLAEQQRDRIRKEEAAKAEAAMHELLAAEQARAEAAAPASKQPRTELEQPEVVSQPSQQPSASTTQPDFNSVRVHDQLNIVINGLHNYTARGLRDTLIRIANEI